MNTMFRCDRCDRTSRGNVQKYSCGTCEKPQQCTICGGLLIRMTDQEMKEENLRRHQVTADRAKRTREESKLPKWCLSAISLIAWENGHSAGRQEVDNIEMAMISDFEIAMRKENTV